MINETGMNDDDLRMVEAVRVLRRSAPIETETLARGPSRTPKGAAHGGVASGQAAAIALLLERLEVETKDAERALSQWRTIQLALGALAVLLVAFLVGTFLLGEPKLEDLVAGSGVIFSGGAGLWIQQRVTEAKKDIASKLAAIKALAKNAES